MKLKITPNLSIITINLNNYNGLERTILSVINQTYDDFEFIIIDGKSKDKSIETILKYDKYITCWTSELDAGIYNAMNKGIQKSSGNYCLFLNSGDWLENETTLSNVFLKGQEADIIAGDIAFFESATGKVKWNISSPEILTSYTLFCSTLPHQATFIKKVLFDKYGLYNEQLMIVSDWLFFLKTLIENKVSYHHHNEVISNFVMDGISFRTETKGISLIEKKNILLEKYPRFLPDYEKFESLLIKEREWNNSINFKAYKILERIYIIVLVIILFKIFSKIKRGFLKQLNLK